jgi:hypothetical protein
MGIPTQLIKETSVTGQEKHDYLLNHANFNSFVVLGDLAYPTNDVMISICRGRQSPPASVAFNAAMCPICTSVEWG